MKGPVAVAVALLAVSLGCAPSEEELTVFAAASLADLAREWQSDCARQGITFTVHSGGSLLLVHQIAAGARADFLLASGTSALDLLTASVPSARLDSAYLHNRMVVVTRAGIAPPASLPELTDARFDHIVLADPDLAPAGRYARDALEKAGLWQALAAHLIKTGDVRMALAAVRTGSADAGFVYATDLAASPGLASTDFGGHDPFGTIEYPLVMLAPETPRKIALWGYLHSESARALARKHGFLP